MPELTNREPTLARPSLLATPGKLHLLRSVLSFNLRKAGSNQLTASRNWAPASVQQESAILDLALAPWARERVCVEQTAGDSRRSPSHAAHTCSLP